MQMRDYQGRAETSVWEAWERVRSVLIVLPTGTGKTIVFSSIAKTAVERQLRVLIVAHREELIEQAADKLKRSTGIVAAIEMAERKEAQATEHLGTLFAELAPDQEPPTMLRGRPAVVVATVQSMIRRLGKFDPSYFDVVIVDEAHHAYADTYKGTLAHFSGAKILGVTATPDRGDKKPLREVFDEVGLCYEIKEAICDGWLVPVRQKYVEVESLDLSRVRTTAGDLNGKDLEDVMCDARVLQEIAIPLIEECGDRQTLIFTASVAHAHALADVMRQHLDDLGLGHRLVASLDGTTDRDERRDVVRRYQEGEIRYLCNCALFTEGFDAPPTGAVAMARPTKSRALYAQMLGRGTRPLDGIVDRHPDDAVARVAAIAESPKPDMLVLDFVGNSGRHSLVNAVDVLDGEASDAAIAIAKRKVEKGEFDDVLEALRSAQREIDAMERARLREQAKRAYTVREIDPFVAFGIQVEPDSWGRPATENQREFLTRKGVKFDPNIDQRQASALIKALRDRQSSNLATYKQANCLLRARVPPDAVWALTFAEASSLMNELVANRWKRPASWDVRFPTQ